MRRHLLTLLALLVLLMQPAALLHALSHGPGGAHATASASSNAAATADADDPHAASGLDCLQCLAFAAIGSAALPAALLLFRAPLLRHAAPGGSARSLPGGTGAGYHARGPPILA
jgi:hypothetical protein